MLRDRRSVWFGDEPIGPASLVTGLLGHASGVAGSPRPSRPDPTVEVIVGLDTTEPTVELERTEYVRVDANYSILARIVKATQVDTIIHTFLVVDPTPDVDAAPCTRSTSSAR